MQCPRCKACGFRFSEYLVHRETKECRSKDPWFQVAEAKEAGNKKLADRLTRKILGVSKPMSAEKKEALKRYNEEHKEEIKQRRQRRLEYVKRFSKPGRRK